MVNLDSQKQQLRIYSRERRESWVGRNPNNIPIGNRETPIQEKEKIIVREDFRTPPNSAGSACRPLIIGKPEQPMRVISSTRDELRKRGANEGWGGGSRKCIPDDNQQIRKSQITHAACVLNGGRKSWGEVFGSAGDS